MADEKTAKPNAEALKTEIEKPEEGVTIRSTDEADNAPAVELTETDEERVTREAAEAGPAGDEPHAGDGDPDDPDDPGDEDPDAQTTAGETETEEERAAKTAKGTDKKPKRHRPRAQERINEALRERYRSDARAAALQKENEELKAAAEKPKPAATTPKKGDTPSDDTPARPVQEDFDGTFEEFLKADMEWVLADGLRKGRADIRKEVQDEIKADRDKQAAEVQLQAEIDAAATFQQHLDETRAAHPDFDDVIENSGDVPVSPPMKEALADSPIAGTVLYHLAKNPALCVEISEMPPGQALVAMGRLEAQLEAAVGGAPGAQAPTTTARQKRRLPRPVTPVGTSSAATTVDPDKMPYTQYKAYREKQERAAAGR